MQTLTRIEQVYLRARLARVPMYRLCQNAGIHPTAPPQWLAGRRALDVDKLGKLEAAMDKIEQEKVG